MNGVKRGDGGFTLIELMVVVLIIAILIAIAIPTFFGARRRAQDVHAKGNVRTALVNQKTFYSSGGSYTDDDATLQGLEPSLAWGNVDAGQQGVLVEDVSANGEGVVLRSLSRSGNLFCLADLALEFDYTPEGYLLDRVGTYYARVGDASASTDCTGVIWDSSSAGWQ